MCGCKETDDVVSLNVNNEIDASIPKKSKYMLEFNDFLTSMVERVSSLHLNAQVSNEIYKLFSDLVKNTQTFNSGLIEDDPDADSKQIFDIATEYICGKIDQFSSGYRRKKKCEQNPLFVPPKELALGLKWEMLLESKIATPKLTVCKFQYISIYDQLTALFQRDDFQTAYWNYNSNPRDDHVCVDGVFKDFCCGKVYKSNPFFQSNPSAVQIHISNDDFEVCNPLGSKATIHKLSGFYFTIHNTPPQFRSKSDNMYPFCICHADDLKTKFTDMNDIWRLVVKDISLLQSVGINTACGQNVKGSLALLSFDNLGINLALGLVACFKATYFCRFCEMAIEDCRRECQEDPSKRRTIESYNQILDQIEHSSKVDFKDSKGVKMKCVLNDLQDFHMLTNLAVDPMHDLNEGVVPVALKALFLRIIKTKILKEDDLFKKVQFYPNYGFLNQRNVPTILSFIKANLGQYAIQIRCLLQHTPFIFWEYRDRQELTDVWACIKSILRIFLICYSPEINQAQIDSLRNEIHNHLNILKQMGITFIAKHHLLTHYPTVIEEMGPVVSMCMFKFERKHKLLKSLMRNNSNFMNVAHTIAHKHQENLSYITDSYKDKFNFGKTYTLSNTFLESHKHLIIQNEIDMRSVRQGIIFLKYCDFYYKKGLFIFVHDKFHEVKHILKIENQFHFVCVQYNVLLFDEFLNSFKIEISPESINSLIEFSNLKHKNVYERKTLNDSLYIICDSLSLLNSLNYDIN